MSYRLNFLLLYSIKREVVRTRRRWFLNEKLVLVTFGYFVCSRPSRFSIDPCRIIFIPPSSTSLFHPPYHSVAFIYFLSENKAEEISRRLEQFRSIASSPNRYSSSLLVAVVKVHSEIFKSNLDLLRSLFSSASLPTRKSVHSISILFIKI